MFASFLTSEFLTLLGLMGAGFAAFGKAIQWYIVRLDAKNQLALQNETDKQKLLLQAETEKQKLAHEEETKLRDKIQEGFEERIRLLEIEIGIQRELVKTLNAERQIFLRRIYQLEAYIQLSKLTVPDMVGWPP